ncbi:MAG: FIG00455141: hypothetical protein [uncultured Paraburkholderia sp.]|nr:MAG: FIG00455141: hypothetical protein [uncultured Paraburkholderia sp.]
MSSTHPFKSAAALIVVSLATACAGSNVFAASSNTRKPAILDTQSGISDGQSGRVLQTAPLSRQPIATPAELAPNSSLPIVVAPYIQLPVGGTPAQPQGQPVLAPRHQ